LFLNTFLCPFLSFLFPILLSSPYSFPLLLLSIASHSPLLSSSSLPLPLI
jgi:hypothetical protein